MFTLLTWPLMLRLPTHFFADDGDGLQNVWNLWWVARAVSEGASPWWTAHLHHPGGVSLLGHTLNPFNGFVALPLSRAFGPVVAHNLIVVGAFVIAGLTAFHLSLHLMKDRRGSLLAGFLFTFSSYHFAHAEGHLQLVSLQWIPLFLLLWIRLLERPSIAIAIAASGALVLVLLCDYYYFGFCVLAAIVVAAARRDLLRPEHRAPLGTFLAAAIVTCGPLLGALSLLALRDPLTGAHAAREFSLDLAAAWIPGGHWRFAALTRPLWSRLPGNIHESSVATGIAASVLAVLAARRGGLGPWTRAIAVAGAVFFLLALGPVLQVAGVAVLPGMPYAWLEVLLPPLRLGGTPVRMIVMTLLAISILAGAGWRILAEGPRALRIVAGAALLAILLETLPRPLPTTRAETPAYVAALRDLPPGAAVDLLHPPARALYYQTIHERPMAFGYLSRLPASVAERDARISEAIRGFDFIALCRDFDLHFAIVGPGPDGLESMPGVEVAYRDDQARILRLRCSL
jgi:hypothetical protein